MPKTPTKRDAEIASWLHASRARFDTEAKIREAAAAEIDASDEELDAIANAWHAGSGAAAASEGPSRGRTGAGEIVDAETGEILDEDIPFDVDDETGGGELELVDRDLVSLFGTGGPGTAIRQVEAYADLFKSFVVEHDLALEMEDGSLYVLAPGVEAGGQLTGWFAEIESVERFEDGWRARAHATQPDTGRRGASREAICLRSEKGKRWKSENELLQTAETRAARKALNGTISVIWNAAGFDSAPPDEKPATPKQRGRLGKVWEQLEVVQPRGKDGWKNYTTRGTIKRFGVRLSNINRAQMGAVIDGMERKLEQLQAQQAGNGDEPAPDDVDSYVPTAEELAEAEGIEF